MAVVLMVTGASGLLGGNLYVTAVKRYQVIGVFHRHAIASAERRVPIQLDISDRAAVDAVISRYRPAAIIHCAALTDVDLCEREPDLAERLNVTGAKNIARAARTHGAALVHISTDAVFDGSTGPYDEEANPNPINVYSRTKLEAEHDVFEVCPDVLVLRTNIYGWSLRTAPRKLSLAEWVLKRLEAGMSVPGFQDVLFTPILVNDLIEVILDLLDARVTGLYHAAGRQGISKSDFARAVAEVFEFPPESVVPTAIGSVRTDARRPRDTRLVSRRVEAILGRPLPDVHAGLARFRSLFRGGFVSELRALTADG